MTRRDSHVLSGMAVLLLLTACKPEDAGHPVQDPVGGRTADAGEHPTDRVDINATVRSNLGITFANVERRPVANTVRVPGSFELQPLARHEYRLMLPGRVEFLVDQFHEVKPGTPIYSVQSPKWPELQHEIILANAAIATAKAQVGVATAGLSETQVRLGAVEARIKSLARADFKRADLEAQLAELSASIPKQQAELVAVNTSLANAERALSHAVHRASAAAGLQPGDLLALVEEDGHTVPRYQAIESIEVAASEVGIVESLAVTDGAFVEATTLLLTTVDPTKLRFRAQGLQSDLPKFRNGLKVRIVPAQAIGSDINESIAAELTVGLDADPNQRTVALFATLSDQVSWTRPGVSAFLEIPTESTGGAVLAIPRSAVVKDGTAHVFFRRDPDNPNLAIRVEADLGVDDGRWVEIKSGVGPNDQVVLSGAYELKLATATRGAATKGGHFHADGTFHPKH